MVVWKTKSTTFVHGPDVDELVDTVPTAKQKHLLPTGHVDDGLVAPALGQLEKQKKKKQGTFQETTWH